MGESVAFLMSVSPFSFLSVKHLCTCLVQERERQRRISNILIEHFADAKGHVVEKSAFFFSYKVWILFKLNYKCMTSYPHIHTLFSNQFGETITRLSSHNFISGWIAAMFF